MRKIIHKLINFGYDIHRISANKITEVHLYKQYKEYTMIPHQVFIDNLQLCSLFKNMEGWMVACKV